MAERGYETGYETGHETRHGGYETGPSQTGWKWLLGHKLTPKYETGYDTAMKPGMKPGGTYFGKFWDRHQGVVNSVSSILSKPMFACTLGYETSSPKEGY